MRYWVMIAALVIMTIPPAIAQDKPIQLALVAPIQIFPENTSITGLRFNFIYGKNTKVTGLDFGLVNHLTAGESKGIQMGLVGIADGDFLGIQDNWVNIANANVEGLQWGFVNTAQNANGLQLGFINYAQKLHGIQIGLINIIKTGGQFPVFPIVNWSF